MTLEEFRSLTDAWGADVERWPQAAREPARRLAAMPQAAEILEKARQLDGLLAARPQVSRERASRAAHAVITHIATDIATDIERERNRQGRWRWQLPAWLVPAASVACSALIGVSLAMLLPDGTDQEALVLSMILDSGSMAAGWTFQ